MDPEDKCPYCSGSLDKKHPVVGYAGYEDHGTATWECEDTGMCFKKELLGQVAHKVQKEYIRNKKEQIIPQRGIWVKVKKLLRILQWI